MNDFISRTALLGYLSKKCAEKDYTTSDMLADIEKYGKNGEVSPLPTLPKEFEVLKNLRDYGGWNFKHYPLSKAEAETIENSMAELKKYRDSGLTAEQLAQVDEEYLKVVQKVPRWRKCSERLPEDLQVVNMVYVNHDPEPYYNNVKDKKFVATGIYCREQWYWHSSTCEDCLREYGRNEMDEVDSAIEIIAWQPLPEWEGEL